MKKFLTIALVALIAMSTVFAGDISFSGRVRINANISEDGVKMAKGNAFSASAKSDYWSATLASSASGIDSANFTASIYLDKLLADQMDFGSTKVTMNINGAQRSTFVYADPTYSYAARTGSGNGVSVVVAAGDLTAKAIYNSSATAYQKGEAIADAQYKIGKGAAKVQAAAGYNMDSETLTVIGSAIANVDKFVEVEKLSASISGFGKMVKVADADATITYGVAVVGGYDALSCYVDFQNAGKYNLAAGVGYDVNAKVSVGADYSISDLADAQAMATDAYLSYSLGNGVSTYFEADYDFSSEAITGLVRVNVAF